MKSCRLFLSYSEMNQSNICLNLLNIFSFIVRFGWKLGEFSKPVNVSFSEEDNVSGIYTLTLTSRSPVP